MLALSSRPLIVATLAASLFGLLALSGVSAGIAAAGTSTLWVQNTSSSDSAMVSIDFYRLGGALEQTMVLQQVGPEQALPVDLSQSILPTGAYAAVITADRPIAVGALTSWPVSGGAVADNGPQPGTDVAVPYLARRFDGSSSLLSIQNTDVSADATVTLKVFGVGESSPTLMQTYNIPPGTSTTLDLEQSVEFFVLGDGFVGHARIESATEVQATAFTDVVDSEKAVDSHDGIPVDRAALDLTAPAVFSEASAVPGGSGSPVLTSQIAVVNVDTVASDVTVEYAGADGGPACEGQTFIGPVVTVAAGASHLISQSGPAANLPTGCRASARIRSSSADIVASVVIRSVGSTHGAAYSAHPTDTAAPTDLYARFVKSVDGLTSFLSVANASDQTATVVISVGDGSMSPAEECTACALSIPARGAAALWLGTVDSIPDGSSGELILSSDQPIASALVNMPVNQQSDMTAMAGGGSAGSDNVRHVTMLFKSRQYATPTPTPFSGTPVASPTPLPTVAGTATPTALPPPTSTPAMPSTPTPDVPPTGTPAFPSTPTPTPNISVTPTPTAPGGGSATATPPPTPVATATMVPPTSLPPSTPTPLPTPAMPTATAVTGGPGAPASDPRIAARVPAAVIAAAMTNPNGVAGWGQLRNPSIPYHPQYNPFRTCLTLRNLGVPWHPLFNPVIFSAGCG